MLQDIIEIYNFFLLLESCRDRKGWVLLRTLGL